MALVPNVWNGSCVKMVVRWLRVRGGGVFAMIAPSVQGVAWDIIGFCADRRDVVYARTRYYGFHPETRDMLSRSERAKIANPTRVVRGGMPGRGDQGSADDARVTFPASGTVSSTITCNFIHVDQAML